MPETRHLIRIYVASPKDVQEERNRLHDVVSGLNMPGGAADQHKSILQVLDWHDAWALIGHRPEQVILDQLPVESWDVFVGMLWMRFGTPSGGQDPVTGKHYDSGTEEEFQLAYDAWKETKRPHILFYRRTSGVASIHDIDVEQYAKVQAFCKQFDASGEHPGLLQSYETPTDFERRVRNDLQRLLPMIMAQTTGEPTTGTPSSTTQTNVPPISKTSAADTSGAAKPSHTATPQGNVDLLPRRLADLSDHINQILDLLKAYEDALLYADDPRTRAKYTREIQNLRKEATIYEDEYGELRGRLGEAEPEVREVGERLLQLDTKLDALIAGQDAMRDDLASMTAAVLARYDAMEQAMINSVLQHLDHSQTATVQAILDAINAGSIPQHDLKEVLRSTREVLEELKQRQPNSEIAKQIEPLAARMDAPDLAVVHRLKLTIPIVPLLLRYEGDLNLSSGVNLGEVWRRLLRRGRG